MTDKLLSDHHLEFLSLKGGCTDSFEYTHVKMPHSWKSHVAAQMHMFCLPEADATSVTLIPDSFAIYPRIVKTTRPLKKELNPTDATHIAVALRKREKKLSCFCCRLPTFSNQIKFLQDHY